MFKSILFVDLDNTLIEGPFESAVFPAVLGEIARKANCEIKDVRRMIVKENFDRQHDPNCSAIHAMDWNDIFCMVARRLGVENLEADAAAIVRATVKEHSRLLDGARQALISLQHPTRALLVATKGLIQYQRPVLEALELTQYFADILTPDTHNALKKDRAFYGAWLDDSFNNYLVPLRLIVGDHYEDDVLSASTFGLQTVWLNRQIKDEFLKMAPVERPQHFEYADDQPVKPTAIIQSLLELPGLIAQLERRNSYSNATFRI